MYVYIYKYIYILYIFVDAVYGLPQSWSRSINITASECSFDLKCLVAISGNGNSKLRF